jgi:hypothetical protein
LLTALSHRTDFAVGCYCEDEARCHRSLLRELVARRGADLACVRQGAPLSVPIPFRPAIVNRVVAQKRRCRKIAVLAGQRHPRVVTADLLNPDRIASARRFAQSL